MYKLSKANLYGGSIDREEPMTRSIDIPTFETALVRYSSPTLAGIKPAALFTYPGVYACEAGEDTFGAIAARRELLLRVLAACEDELGGSGIRLRVLVWRPCGALVYAYRPFELASYLSDPQAARPLSNLGYDLDDLDACIARLAKRVAVASRSAAECACPASCPLAADGPCDESCVCGFPHEMGYFLGFPYADVSEFIRQRGENYAVLGPWKVYADVPRALRTFERYRRCTDYFTHVYQRGHGIAQLASAPRKR